MVIENYSWYDIITKNWSQIVVLIGAIGYLIKVFNDFKFKKYEILFYRIQENKILEVKIFYKCYNHLQTTLFNFTKQTLGEQVTKEKAKELRFNVDIAYTELRNNCSALKLFVNENEIKLIDEILHLYHLATFDIAIWHSKIVAKANYEFKNEFYDIQIEKIPDLIKEFEQSFRKSYNLDRLTFLEKMLLYFKNKINSI